MTLSLGHGLGVTHAFSKGAGDSFLPASNNVFVINGDSRTQQAVSTDRSYGSTALTDPDDNADETKAAGWVSHMLASIGHRLVLPRGGQFAIGAERTDHMAARAVQDAAQAAGYGAGAMIFLGGVNDATVLTLQQSIDNYTTIFNAFAAQGIRLVVCNELPRDGMAGTSLSNQLGRKAWLEDPQRAVDWSGILQVDTFNACLKDGTQADWKDGYSIGDGLHPGYAGSKAIGEAIAAAVGDLWPEASFPSLLELPTSATGYLNTNPMLTGTSGAKAGTPPPTGDLASGWYMAGASGDQTGITCVASKSVDPEGYDEQVLTISGSSALTTARGYTLTNTISAGISGLAAGTRIRLHGRLRIDAGHTGLLGVKMGTFVQGVDLDAPGSGFDLKRGSAFGSLWTAGQQLYEMDGTAVDYEIMSQDMVIPDNWAAATGKNGFAEVAIQLQSHSFPISCVVRLSRIGVKVVI